MSYSPVYSVPFIEYTAAAPNETFLVPEGMTAVIRWAGGYVELGEDISNLWISGDLEAPKIYVAVLTPAGINTVSTWSGRVVALEGYTIGIDTANFGELSTVYVGGYLLRNVIS